MKTIAQTEASYTFLTAAAITARYHDGRTRRAVPVLVTREDTGALYTVLVPTDGGPATCTCQDYQRRHKGTNSAGCKHASMAIGHLLREAAPAPAAVSPAILSQLGMTAEEEAKAEAERARVARLQKAEEERILWD